MKIEEFKDEIPRIRNFENTCSVNYWDTSLIQPIKKKDGSWVLGVSIYESPSDLRFYEIQITDDNIPYLDAAKIVVLDEVADNFVINKGAEYGEYIEGYPLMEQIPNTYSIHESKSVFTLGEGYRGNTKHYLVNGYSIYLEKEAVAMFVKMMSLPEIKKLLDKRMAKNTDEEIKNSESEFVKFSNEMSGVDESNIDELYQVLQGLDGGLNGNPIEINLEDYEYLLRPTGQYGQD